MKNEGDQFPKNENIESENTFLKMKLMLERGAHFGKSDSKEFPTEIENEFLKNIIEFEKQFDEHKTIRVFDKIEKPVHFKPVDALSIEEIEQAREELSDYLDEFGIRLEVCSPNISKKELYRFTIEELFEYKMNDIDVPGMMHSFIYDEFHPDAIYENTNAAIDECMHYLLRKEPIEWTPHFNTDNLQLNNHTGLSEEELKIIVNMFKLAYDNLEIKSIIESECIVNEEESWVTGIYNIVASSGKEICVLAGNWKVVFEKDDICGYWYINNIQVEGINF